MHLIKTTQRGLDVTKTNSDKKIGRRVTALREQRGLTQAELSRQSSITPAAISQIESGDRVPSTPILRRLCSVLGVSMDYLTGASEEVKIEDLLVDEKVQKFFRGYQSLSAADQKLIEQQVEFLKSRNQSKK